jgi:hypothetical protein
MERPIHDVRLSPLMKRFIFTVEFEDEFTRGQSFHPHHGLDEL